jgi:hypothetical protein
MDLLYRSSDDDDDDEDTSQSVNVGVPERKIFVAKSSKIASPLANPTKARSAVSGKRILSLASVLPAHLLNALTKQPGKVDDDSDSSDNDDSAAPGTRLSANAKPSNAATTLSTEFSSFLQDLHKVGYSNGNRINNEKSVQGDGSYGKDARLLNIYSEKKETLGSDFVTHFSTTISRKSNENSSHLVRDIHNEDTARVAKEGNETEEEHPSATAVPTRVGKIMAAPPVGVVHCDSAEILPTESSTAPLSTSMYHDVKEQQLPSNPRPLSRKEIERTLRRNTNGVVNIESLWNETGLTQTQQGVDPKLNASNVLPRKAPAPPSGLRNVATHLYDPSTGTTVAHDPTTGNGIGKGRGKNQINHLLAQAVRLERERTEQDQYHVATGVKLHRANAKRKYGW